MSVIFNQAMCSLNTAVCHYFLLKLLRNQVAKIKSKFYFHRNLSKTRASDVETSEISDNMPP